LSVAKKDKELTSVSTPNPESVAHLNWENRMSLWKEKLQASGTIKSFEELQRDLWKHDSTSALALLQAHVKA
jgi:RNA polymerase-interacting CarD/CdnL/TRCF family regulator